MEEEKIMSMKRDAQMDSVYRGESPEVYWSEAEERRLNEHMQREGSGPVNQHPDGCYYCGSAWHMSDCCPNKES